MNIETKFLGNVTIAEESIINFEFGLPGFSHILKYAIIPFDEKTPFMLLQSIEEKEIGFITIYPFAFKPDYVFDISEDDKRDLQIESEEDVIVYSIVTLNETLATSTINLLAPVVINIKKKLGKQIVLSSSEKYPLRHPIGELEGSAK